MSTLIITRRIAIAAVCLILAAGLAAYVLMQLPNRTIATGEALIGGPFTLVNQDGENVTDKTYLGAPMLLFFGFTFCPDVCPTELQVMAAALAELGARGSDIQPVFVTVDPERDNPQVMKDYVANFSDRFIGLTGSPEQVAAMASTYKVYFAKAENKQSPENYLMDHSSIIYLMGPDGKFLKHFTYSTDAKALAQGIATALNR